MNPSIKLYTPASSCIDLITYNHKTLELTVHYKQTGPYIYVGVPSWEFDSLVNADSVGSYIHQEIKPSYDVVRQDLVARVFHIPTQVLVAKARREKNRAITASLKKGA